MSENNEKEHTKIEGVNVVKSSEKIRFIDLFSGMGSFHYSFAKAGMECVMASDICEATKSVYNSNYGLIPRGDIYDIKVADVPKYDILCAGFPCQPFSKAGKRKGFDDERGTVFYQIMKFVKHHSPRIIVFENVKSLLSHNKGETFKTMKKAMEDEGYEVIHKVLTCDHYGIPQGRKRLFIVGYKNIKANNIENFFELEKYKKKVNLSDYLGRKFEREKAFTIRCGGKASPIDDRHNWDGYWIEENGERIAHRLTIKEALKLQGFDENYKFEGKTAALWKMLGNTIPTIFTKIIAEQLLYHFEF